MSAAWALSAAAFEKLLAILGPDREAAGRRYETLRSGLVRLFRWRGCRVPETLADVAIDRVCRRIDDGVALDPARAEAYFHGVARLVLLEHFKDEARRQELTGVLPSAPPSPLESLVRVAESQHRLRCLGRCRGSLPETDWQLVQEYYASGAAMAVTARSAMARRHGISDGNLRVRVFRSRRQLQACLERCLTGREGARGAARRGGRRG